MFVRATAAPRDDRVRLRVEVQRHRRRREPGQARRTCSTRSPRPTPRRPGSTAAPGSAWRSARRSSRPWAARSATPRTPAAAASSPFTACSTTVRRRRLGDRSGSAADARARERLAGLRALVVDDNETNRLILREQLAWWRVESDSAAAVGRGAGAAGRPRPYDVVLLDLSMPERDGLDLARQVRADPALADAPAADAHLGDHARRRRGRAPPASPSLLTKPVLSSVLRTVLLRLLGGASHGRDDGEPAAEAAEQGTVLVVEDNPVNQIVATGLLDALGYAAATAEDGAGRDRGGPRGGFDAILMDVQMPRMDGYAATRAHPRGRGRHAPPDHRDDRRRGRGRARALPGGRHGRLPHQAGRPGPPGRDPRAVARAAAPAYADRLDMERLDELRELDDRPARTSYVDRAIRNFLATRSRTRRRPPAAAAGDAGQLGAIAHRLAGAALNLGATRSARPPGRLEQHVRQRRRLAEAASRAAAAGRGGSPRTSTALRAYRRPLPGASRRPSPRRPRRPRRAAPRGGPAPPAPGSARRCRTPSSICRLRSVAKACPSSPLEPVADLFAGRVEDGQLLLGEVVVDHLGQLLDGVVEGLGVGALELEHRQHRLVALGVLLLAVLGLVLGDRVAALAAWGRRAAPRRRRARCAGSPAPGVRRRGRTCCRAGRAAASRSGGGRRGSGR